MKKKSKVIDVDEFFKLLEMLTNIDEDKEMALAILEASNYQDRKIIDKLLAKAMVFEDRFKFCAAVKLPIVFGSFKTSRLYAYLDKHKCRDIYLDILRKIKEND